MKRIIFGILAIMMAGLSGCGETTTVTVNPPSITSYRFTKDAVTEYIDGNAGYFAPDSDIDSMTVVVFDSRGFEISRTKTFLNLPGITQGTVFFSIDYLTYPADKFTFSIYLTDFNGYTSNQIVDTFQVP